MALSATREQLLLLRQQMEAVRRGKSLLERKRDALLRALEEDRRRFRALQDQFEKIGRRVATTYSLLRLYEGQISLDLLRPGMGPVPLESFRHVLMGCSFVEFHRHESAASGVGYDPTLASLFTDDLVGALAELDAIFWTYLNLRVKMGALEKTLRETVRKTSNLEHRVLPGLRGDFMRIRDVLVERERQERYTLRKAVRRREKGTGEEHVPAS